MGKESCRKVTEVGLGQAGGWTLEPITAELSPSRHDEFSQDTSRREPQTEVEQKLARIWQQVLGISTVGAFDDFFELGGDSLAATVLAAEIEATFGIQFHLSDVITLSTVAKQAWAVVRDASSAKARLPSHLTVGRASGSQQPLFVVHGGWGFSFFNRVFFDALGQDRPVYLFQAPGLDGRTRPLESVEQIADAYVASIREIQPGGPYCIAAMCSGSFIALEMCHLIEAAGLNVDRLILLDPRTVPKAVARRADAWRYWAIMCHLIEAAGLNVDRLILLDPRTVPKAVARRADAWRYWAINRLNRYLKTEKDSTYLASSEIPIEKKIKNKILESNSNAAWIYSAQIPKTMSDATRTLRLALGTYVPRRPYAGKAVILVTSEKEREILGDGSFWRSHLNGIEYQVCEWAHQDLFEAHIVETARFVKNALETPWDPRLIPGARIGRVS